MPADENVDHRVVHGLRHFGHDVEHVDFVDAFWKGTDDATIAWYVRTHDRLLLTSDDDFLTVVDPVEYAGLLFIENERLSAEGIADVVEPISELLEQSAIDSVFYVSSNWL